MAQPFQPGSYAIRSHVLQRYLVCGDDGTLQFSGMNPNDPNAKFEVETANVNNLLVNIKSKNGNYWRKVDKTTSRIWSKAVDPHEDVSSWNGTLFNIKQAGTRQGEYRILQKYHENFIEPIAEDNNNAYALQATLTDNQALVFERR